VLRAIASTAEIGRSILTTPGVPPERLAALRKAFAEMVKDPAFLAAAKKRNITIEPGTGEAMDEIVRETMRTPKNVLKNISKLVN
jgi:tripartite-type tricarboxylate transporter receptor subunit TctC